MFVTLNCLQKNTKKLYKNEALSSRINILGYQIIFSMYGEFVRYLGTVVCGQMHVMALRDEMCKTDDKILICCSDIL
jgi:hypothetical protein